MAHFAHVIDGVVRSVIVLEEHMVADWTARHITQGELVQTSYNTFGGTHKSGGTPLRKNYAGVGYTYDRIRDAFYAPKPYPSWNLDEDSCLWEPPIAYPADGQHYVWSEEDGNWVQDSNV